ncbi:hypothetical protein BX600DRAFT_509418 [Xylariales sp. PMI_506]|nr:hypothetical protein BX600DRAFT_509418 [Xylariales sp. PMI_506]
MLKGKGDHAVHGSSAVYRRWIGEIAACVIALLAIMATVVTLRTHDGLPLPEWPLGISINALVSIYSIILKAAMMVAVAESLSQLKWSWYTRPRPLSDISAFDRASRGLWGSLKLMVRLRGMHLASFGAAITILSIANEPFIQQVIHTYPCPQTSATGVATLPRTNTYAWQSIHVAAATQSLEAAEQAPIYQGAYSSIPQVQPGCVSGNCTFPEFKTVAMCSECKDVSGTLNYTGPSNDTALDGNGDLCRGTWSLPSGLNITFGSLRVAAMAPTNSTTTVDFETPFPYSTNLLAFPSLDTLDTCNGATPAQQPLALQCSLYPCIRTYSSKVSQTNLTESIIHEEPFDTSKDGDNLIFDVSMEFSATPMPCLLDGDYYNASHFVAGNQSNTSIPTYGLLENNQTAYLPRECYFGVSGSLGLVQFFQTYLLGYFDTGILYNSKPSWLGGLYSDTTNSNVTIDTFNSLWGGIADSMTAKMRNTADLLNVTNIAGKEAHNETCISVQWQWLIFPIALVIMSMLFLVATIIESARQQRLSQIQIWKSSPQALLFSGLDPGLRDSPYGATDTKEQMDQRAAGMLLQLERQGDDGFRFVPTSRS